MRVNSVISALSFRSTTPETEVCVSAGQTANAGAWAVWNPSPVDLDGVWTVERVSGALPPMSRVRKRIDGASGVTVAGLLRMRFDVRGNELRYRAPFFGVVDVLEPAGEGWSGRASWFGREFGRFRMSRVAARRDHPEQPV